MSGILNAYDKALHDKIHENMLNTDPKYLLDNPRLKVLDMISDFEISGHVADVGCGSGYFGIGVAKRFDLVDKVDCIEASTVAVERVIPRNINYFGVSSKVEAVEGSFDLLPGETYDVIFAMGALHHSRNLNDTIHSIFKALKPGGLLVAQEPAMPDSTTHEAYQEKYNIVEEKFGLKIKNGDRYDRFFRECEYKYFLVSNGFDICLWEKFQTTKNRFTFISNIVNYAQKNGLKATLIKVMYELRRRHHEVKASKDSNWIIRMRAATKNVEKKLIVAKKSGVVKIFHCD